MFRYDSSKIDDRALADTNALFDWRAVANLPDGRMLGKASSGKREKLQTIPDQRIITLNKLVRLSGKSVLEIGCFEGIHTVGLLSFTDEVTAIDVRPVNVFKTLARLSLHGHRGCAFVADCENIDSGFGTFDVIFHFGVLYHLTDPVGHLHRLGSIAPTLYLDTHIAAPNAKLESETHEGMKFEYSVVREGGWKDPFSGTQATSKHLTLDSLRRALSGSGYIQHRVIQFRRERHGPRVLILASRSLDLRAVQEVDCSGA